MSGQAPRRSARLSSRATATPMAQPASTREGLTPLRGTSALPAIQTAKSRAYGARGRAVMGEHIRAADIRAGFSEAFHQERSKVSLAAVEETPAAEESNAAEESYAAEQSPAAASEQNTFSHLNPTPTPATQMPSSALMPPPAQRMQNPSQRMPPRSPTIRASAQQELEPLIMPGAVQHRADPDVSKSFGNGHEAAFSNQVSPSQKPQQDGPRQKVVLDAPIQSIPAFSGTPAKKRKSKRLSHVRAATKTVQRSPRDIMTLLISLLLGFAVACMMLGANLYDARSNGCKVEEVGLNPFKAIKYYSCNTYVSFTSGLSFLTATSTSNVSITANLVGRVNEAEKMYRLHDETLKRLQDELPEFIAVRKTDNVGGFEVTDKFWAALGDRVEQLRTGEKSLSEGSPWHSFLEANEAHTQAIVGSFIDNRVKSVLDSAFAGWRTISREEFTESMEARYASMFSEIDSRYGERLEHIAAAAAGRAVASATNHLRELPLWQLEAFARTNLALNAELALKRVNFFSPHIGAVVDPHLTSPTQGWVPLSWAQLIFGSFSTVPQPPPPVMALERWEELSECWCSAEAPGGQSQLAVIMPLQIWPSAVTVEHMPREGSLDILSAPKWMELWVEVASPRDLLAVTEYRRSSGLQEPFECSGSPVGQGYACAGRWMYDIHGPNHVQTFRLDVDFQSLGVRVKKSVIRVTESWGRDYTCLYRLRMHGDVAVEPSS